MAEYTTIDDAGSFYKTLLYSGTGSELAVTGVGFQPDFCWIKGRNYTYAFGNVDSVRGVQETLYSNSNDAEATLSTGLTAFGADGFTVISDNIFNGGGGPLYVSWNWKAGTTSGLSGGTITPSAYSINPTSGFGIYAYTGTGSAGTIAHGLGVAPTAMIVKQRSLVIKDWYCYHQNMTSGNGYHVTLNTDAATASGTEWNSTDPDATVFTVGANSNVNAAADTYIAYVFAPVQGFSKFGYFTGDAQADGPFVYTGFRPAFVMLKVVGATTAWNTFDDKRSNSGYNMVNKMMQPNDGAVEVSSTDGVKSMDLLSNGFKMRATNAEVNTSGGRLLYWAFAEAPFVNSSGVPGNAR